MRKLLVLLLALSLTISAKAQFGIVVGWTSTKSNISEIKQMLDIKDDLLSANFYHFGITYKLPLLGELVVIQPSLIYNVKGMKIGDAKSLQTFGTSIEYETGYLELPIQLQAGVRLGSLLRIYGIGEPYIGYAIANKATTTVLGQKLGETWSNVSSRLEYGVSAGLGVELMEHLQVSAKYFWNFGSMYNFDFGDTINQMKSTKSNGIIASIAYIF